MNEKGQVLESLQTPNVLAFLHVIREGESSQADDAYTLVNGGTHFATFAAHPFDGIPTTQGGRAAGAYQFLGTTWKGLREQYGFTDFEPHTQDLGAIALIKEKGAIADLESGAPDLAIAKLKGVWTSLPGASENRASFTLAVASRIYAQYGGQLQAEESVVADQTQPSSTGLGGILGAIGPILTAINPIAGAIITAFTPLAQEKIAKEINRHTDDPTVGQQIADSVIKAAQNVTGQADPIDAASAVRKDPAAMQQVEQSTVDKLNELAPIFDKLQTADQSLWAAQQAGADAAAKRAQGDKWDMTPWLVWISGGIVALISIALAGTIVAQSLGYNGAKGIDTALIGLAGPLFALVFRHLGEIYAYRFDGSKESSAKDAMIAQLAGSK